MNLVDLDRWITRCPFDDEPDEDSEICPICCGDIARADDGRWTCPVCGKTWTDAELDAAYYSPDAADDGADIPF